MIAGIVGNLLAFPILKGMGAGEHKGNAQLVSRFLKHVNFLVDVAFQIGKTACHIGVQFDGTLKKFWLKVDRVEPG